MHSSLCALCLCALLQDDDKALHKCQQDQAKFELLRGDRLLDEQRPTGFCSAITVGSLLPFKTAIMKGSMVELLARRWVSQGGCGWGGGGSCAAAL
jgi:hypothetical protein